MKTELPERSKEIKHDLERIMRIIFKSTTNNVSKIILYGSYARGDWVSDRYVENHITYEYESDIDILVILNSRKNSNIQCTRIYSKISDRIENAGLEVDRSVEVIVEPLARVNEQLEKGRYFFSDIKKEGILLYDDGETELAEKQELSNEEKKELVEQDYKKWFFNGTEFLMDSIYISKRRNYPKSTFELHQATECFYNTILLVFTGYKPKTHKLNKLRSMSRCCSRDLYKIFSFITPEHKKCFKLLCDAYVDARYEKDYEITPKQLEYLINEVERLKELTQKICLAKIASLN